jgi:D-tyrosyl-tRNA(Tyr) deacylase
MKFVIQRVLEGSVKVNGETVGKINRGLVVLIGFTHSDKPADIKFAANKLLNIRLWDDNNGVRWKECVKSKNYEILLVSQFTLYSFFKGNKPDFHKALEPEPAVQLYNTFVDTLKKIYIPEKIQTGRFGEMMEVSLINDGPVTLNWEYPELNEEEGLLKDEIINVKLKKENNQIKNNSKNMNSKSNGNNPITKADSNTKKKAEMPVDLNKLQIALNDEVTDKIEINVKSSESLENRNGGEGEHQKTSTKVEEEKKI